MKHSYLYASLLITRVICQSNIPWNEGEFYISDGDSWTWQSPNPYKESQNLVVHGEIDYLVQITVKSVDIDGSVGDFLLIKSGTSLEDDKTGRIFTHQLRTERSFLSLTNNVFISFQVYGLNLDNHTGFTLDVQRFGETPPTTIPTTTDINWPTPSDSDSIFITTNISGRYPEDYENNRDDFKGVVAAMATVYCNINNLHLAENTSVTEDNILINSITQCPVGWRNRATCVQIRFSLPIFLNQELERYELTSANLEIMWSTMSDEYLARIGLANYVLDDTGHIILIWLVAICLTILLFGAVIYVSRLIGLKRIKAAKKPPDVSSLYQEEKRLSGDSLGPHPLQAVPNLFEQFPIYDPADLSPKLYASPGITEAELDLQQFTFVDEELNKSSEL